jgi:hypothetical protein
MGILATRIGQHDFQLRVAYPLELRKVARYRPQLESGSVPRLLGADHDTVELQCSTAPIPYGAESAIHEPCRKCLTIHSPFRLNCIVPGFGDIFPWAPLTQQRQERPASSALSCVGENDIPASAGIMCRNVTALSGRLRVANDRPSYLRILEVTQETPDLRMPGFVTRSRCALRIQ